MTRGFFSFFFFFSSRRRHTRCLSDWSSDVCSSDLLNRKTPTQLFAAMYDKDRKPWQIVESGPKSGLYKTDDAGEKWTLLTGGLPTGKIGRIGIDMYQKNPLILYALLENQNQRTGDAGAGAGARGGRGG